MEIVLRQVSGLGNQLFQFAAGRFYARRYGASLRIATELPRNAFSHGYARPFLLSHFSMDLPMAPLSRLERALFSTRRAFRLVQPALQRAGGIEIFSESVGQRYTFLEDVPHQPQTRRLYLVGYWQTYRIPEALEPELRKDLVLRGQPDAANAAMLERIKSSSNPISLHIRRGDYTLAAEGHLALPLSYYDRAMRWFSERTVDPEFFVFSDDIPFARASLPVHWKMVFVDHNNDVSSHEDLRLMSACHHHIIANSSFSWWGAWLNPRPDKHVYAPRCWHLTPQSFYPDLLPPDWITATL